MGSDRKRSNTPLLMSVLSPIPVYMVIQHTVITTMPGSSPCR